MFFSLTCGWPSGSSSYSHLLLSSSSYEINVFAASGGTESARNSFIHSAIHKQTNSNALYYFGGCGWGLECKGRWWPLLSGGHSIHFFATWLAAWLIKNITTCRLLHCAIPLGSHFNRSNHTGSFNR